MKTILVVDDMAVFREPIAAALCHSGWDAFCASDGEEALSLARSKRPDLIVLDMLMPKMDGLAFLKRLRAEPAIAGTRVILLTESCEKDKVLAAATLGVKDYVLKSRFRLTDLMERINKVPTATVAARAGSRRPDAEAPETWQERRAREAAVSNAKVPQVLTREQFLKKVEQVFDAKALSGIVAQVISMASSPRSDTGALAALIAQDAMLSARVLAAANSAAYSSAAASVTTIPEAVLKIGCNSVRNIAAALGVFDCMPAPGADGFNPIRCWQHSLAVAQVAEQLAMTGCKEEAGLAYVVGLCHDVGDLFIRTQFGKEYQQVVELATRTGRSRQQVHLQMFGMTSAQMISAVVKHMGLPDAIREPIEILHSPHRAQSKHPLAGIVWVAENYVNAAMVASGPTSEVEPIDKAWCEALFGQALPLPSPQDAQKLRSEVFALTVMLARLSRAEEAALMVPMFEPRKTAIWVATDPTFSEFDFVGSALGSMSTVTAAPRLPSEHEVVAVNGLVVVARTKESPGFAMKEIEAIVAKAGATGRSLSVIALAPDASTKSVSTNDIVGWRPSISLAELSAFVDAANVTQAAQRAA